MKQTFIDAFKGMLLTFPDAVVTVVNGDKTAQGFARFSTSAEMGTLVKESVSGECQVLVDDIGVLSYATLIKIGERMVYVTSQQIDMMSVVNKFTFTSTSPATGEVFL